MKSVSGKIYLTKQLFGLQISDPYGKDRLG